MSKRRMSRSKSTTTKSVKSERLVFSEALNAFGPQLEKLEKITGTLKDFSTEALTKLDLKIEAKKTEFEELKEKYKNELKNEQIQLDLFLKEHEYNGALEILEKRGEVAIVSTELENLRKELATLKNGQKEEIEAVRKEMDNQSKIALNSAVKMKDLEHQAKTAEVNAKVKELSNEIESQKLTIETLREELAKQRELTRSVAEAGRQGQIVQNMGKH